MILRRQLVLPSPAQPVYSLWSFSDPSNPLRADQGSATLSYLDNNSTGWPARGIVLASVRSLALPSLPIGDKRVMGFPYTRPEQGFILTQHEAPNGYFARDGLVSNYTIVMDMFWPSGSAGVRRELLQNSIESLNDADWFVDASKRGGIGVFAHLGCFYFGSLRPNSWHRIALVARVANPSGLLRFFVDGYLVSESRHARKHWALLSQSLLFADNSFETEKGYVSNIFFAGYAM